MHRSRLSVLVILAALSACSTRDAVGANEAAAGELLVQDPTLVARLDMDQDATRRLPLPDACGPIAPAVQPAAAIGTQAEELARQGYDAEAHGNVREAHALLRRASELDGTNKSAAYHLGRTSEALGDRVAAITSYCRYLTLTPTSTESVEARERVVRLSQPETRVAAAAATVGDSAQTVQRARTATAPRATVRPATVRPATVRSVVSARPKTRPQLVASAAGAQSVAAPSPERVTPSASATGIVAADTTSRVLETGAPAVEGAAGPATDRAGDGAMATGEVVAAPRAIPAADQPSTTSGTGRRGPSRAQSAGIGAATGAIIGAITGRGVKGAVIGAAAGGMLGTTIGGASWPAGRGIVPVGRGRLPIGRGIRP